MNANSGRSQGPDMTPHSTPDEAAPGLVILVFPRSSSQQSPPNTENLKPLQSFRNCEVAPTKSVFTSVVSAPPPDRPSLSMSMAPGLGLLPACPGRLLESLRWDTERKDPQAGRCPHR